MSLDSFRSNDSTGGNARPEPDDGPPPPSPADADTLAPLDGEAGIPSVNRPRRAWLSWRRLSMLGAGLVLVGSLVALWAQRALQGGAEAAKVSNERTANRPTAALAEPRRLDLLPASSPKPAAPPAPLIPALVPGPQDSDTDPIGLRQRATHSSAIQRRTATLPEDAPVLLVSGRAGPMHPSADADEADDDLDASVAASPIDPRNPLQTTQRNLQAYQRQLDGMLNQLKRATGTVQSRSSTSSSAMPGPGMGYDTVVGHSTGPDSSPLLPTEIPSTAQSGIGLFGGQLQRSATPRVMAGMLGNRSLTLPKGTAFTCALKTKVISATSGLVGCQVQRNVYGDDGRVLLVERGSHLDGEYRVASVRPGMVRIPVLWTRIRTPLGVTVDIDSPGTGQLGESGIDGYVDNRWGERIGAAMLLSLIDDAVQLVVQNQSTAPDRTTILMPSTTDNTSKLAEKVLDSTINIPPLIYQNQGGIVGIYVARDVDFSSVYELKPTAVAPQREGTP